MNNAIQAVERDDRIEMRVLVDADADDLLLEVRDSGPGVSADKQSTIFEPFFTTKAEGSGLGLWIVQQIITAHGGAVSVANAPGGGAVFAVHLPLRKKQDLNG